MTKQGDDFTLKATDLFPDLSDDIDRRIAHAEVRIKYWVMAGILANLLAIVLAAIPLVFYLGSIQSQTAQALSKINDTADEVDQRRVWMQNREIWEAQVQTYLEAQGFKEMRRR